MENQQNSCDCSTVAGFFPYPAKARRPKIGLFDSGMGGLSVLHQLHQELPGFDYVYLGDTARFPYGTRTSKTISAFSLQAARFLHGHHVDALVVACNTASSVSLDVIRKEFPAMYSVGMVDAGAQAAVQQAPNGNIAVIATECTVATRSYEKAIVSLAPMARVHSKACPFLVSLAEEGWTEGRVACMTLNRYLQPLLAGFTGTGPDCLILGCTHFALFSDVIHQIVGPEVSIIDPARALSSELSRLLGQQQRAEIVGPGGVEFYATDALERFARVGEKFLGKNIVGNTLHRAALDNL